MKNRPTRKVKDGWMGLTIAELQLKIDNIHDNAKYPLNHRQRKHLNRLSLAIAKQEQLIKLIT